MPMGGVGDKSIISDKESIVREITIRWKTYYPKADRGSGAVLCTHNTTGQDSGDHNM